MSMDNKKVALLAARACDSKKANDIRLINIISFAFFESHALAAMNATFLLSIDIFT